jgi:hypothetical protein
MGLTWPNLDGETVVEPGYYWSERLRKLARLQVGEKLPRRVGPWEMVAPEGQLSSSQVARMIFDRYPGLKVNDFTYTTTSPLARRLPMGDPPLALSGLQRIGPLALAFVTGGLLAWLGLRGRVRVS